MALRFIRILGATILCAGITSCGGGSTGTTGTGQVRLASLVTGLTNPLFLGSARDGTGRLFIVEQPGRIKVLQPGSSNSTVYLDISAKVISGGEQGLLGLAFHPQFQSNRRFFVNYTRIQDGATVVSELQQSVANPNVADGAEKIILVIPQPFENHNGGMIAFGLDGFLYIGMGDGGSANDPLNNAQNPASLLGKMLRIDIDRPSSGIPYGIPPGNPFAANPAYRPEIYALGLRNPWRFSFDRATGSLIAGDVGQNALEEIDVIQAGANYGWRVMEASRCTGNDPALCSATGYSPPVAEYDHSSGRCAVTGGYAYRGSRGTLPAGAYIYGDYCSGEIWALQNGSSARLLSTSLHISSFGEDESGEIYVVDLGGAVYRIST